MKNKRKSKQKLPSWANLKGKSSAVCKTDESKTDEVDAPKLKSWHTARFSHLVAVTTVVSAVYMKTVHPSVPGGDSGELIVSAHEFGVAHPPGYPLFTLLAKLFIEILPFGTIAWRVNILNAVLSSLAATALFATVTRLTGSPGSALYSTALYAFSLLTWTWSTSAEVFSLNNLFTAILLYLIIDFEKACGSQQKDVIIRKACRGALVCGLAMCNQHTIVLYIAPVAVWVLLSIWKVKALNWRSLVQLTVSFLLGLLPYLYLPFSSHLNVARWTWGDQHTFAGFLVHLLRREYGTFDLGKNEEGLGLLIGLRAYTRHLFKNLIFTGPVFAGVAVVLAARRQRTKGSQAVFLYIFMQLLYLLFFTWRANLNLTNPLYKGVVERFWLQSDLIVAALAGLGYHQIVKLVTSIISPNGSTLAQRMPFLGACVVMFAQLQNYSLCDQSSNIVIKEFGTSLLQALPQRAIVFTKGDLPTNSMRYLHLCEKLRPDVDLIDVEILSYGWSLPMLKKFYPRVQFPGDFWQLTNQDWPDGRRSFNFRHLLDVNYQRSPIYVCIGMQEYDDSWKEDYDLWPYGVCHRVIKKGDAGDPQKWANVTAPIADNWLYPHDSFNEKSWEHVANGEMWHAKISTPFFMFQLALDVADPKTATMLLVSSYQLYSRALEKHKSTGYPPFWHKNYALVCEKLMQISKGKRKKELCKSTIEHFNLYLSRNPMDPENSNIRTAVETLTEWLENNVE